MTGAKRATQVGLGLIAAAALIGCQAEQEAKKPSQPRFNPQAVAVEARAQDMWTSTFGQFPLDTRTVSRYPPAPPRRPENRSKCL